MKYNFECSSHYWWKKKLYLNKCSHFHIFHQRGRILLPSKYHSLRMWLSTSDSIHFYCREHTMCASKYIRTNMHIQNKWESSFCMNVCVCVHHHLFLRSFGLRYESQGRTGLSISNVQFIVIELINVDLVG